MSTAIWITLLFTTGITSFFIGSLYTKRQYEHSKLEQEVDKAQSELAQFKQDVSDHLAHTNKLVDRMQDNYTQLVNHMEETDKLLLAAQPAEVVPYFSQEATELLTETRNSDITRSELMSRNAELRTPPADFVSGETGIFSGHNAEEEHKEKA
jgi:hypothetical protein